MFKKLRKILAIVLIIICVLMIVYVASLALSGAISATGSAAATTASTVSSATLTGASGMIAGVLSSTLVSIGLGSLTVGQAILVSIAGFAAAYLIDAKSVKELGTKLKNIPASIGKRVGETVSKLSDAIGITSLFKALLLIGGGLFAVHILTRNSEESNDAKQYTIDWSHQPVSSENITYMKPIGVSHNE